MKRASSRVERWALRATCGRFVGERRDAWGNSEWVLCDQIDAGFWIGRPSDSEMTDIESEMGLTGLERVQVRVTRTITVLADDEANRPAETWPVEGEG